MIFSIYKLLHRNRNNSQRLWYRSLEGDTLCQRAMQNGAWTFYFLCAFIHFFRIYSNKNEWEVHVLFISSKLTKILFKIFSSLARKNIAILYSSNFQSKETCLNSFFCKDTLSLGPLSQRKWEINIEKVKFR